MVHHGRRDRHCIAWRFLPQPGSIRYSPTARSRPRRSRSFPPAAPCASPAATAQRPLAVQQRHPPFRMGARRNDCRRDRGGKRRPPDRHVLGHAGKGRDAVRQLGRRDGSTRHRQLSIFRSRTIIFRSIWFRVGLADSRSRAAAVRLICCRRSATSPRNTAAWRSGGTPRARRIDQDSRRPPAARSARQSSTNARSSIGRSPKPT